MVSLWDAAERADFPSLQDNVRCDVAIVGAGIAGLTTAYKLAKEGASVCVLEESFLGRGETGLTSAHLSNALDDRYWKLEKLHGAIGAKLAANSHTAAIDTIGRIADELNIQCDYERVPGYLFAHDPSALDELKQEFAAAHRAGLSVSWESNAPWKTFRTGRCIVFPDQAQFHPLKYLFGLSKALGTHAKLYAHTRVTGIASGQLVRLTTEKGNTVEAKHVVVATNVPFHDRVVMHTKQAAYRSYVIVLPIPKGDVTKALYWDTGDPYHYLRLAASDNPQEDLLLVGGEDHKTGQLEDTEVPFFELEKWARLRFPQGGKVAVRWSGQIIEPIDGLAFIGRNPLDHPNSYIVTGDSGNGLTHGTIAGLLLTDLIMGRANPWAKLYDPSRKTLASAGQFLKENLNAVTHYLDWLKPGNAQSVQDLAPGQGAIIRDGLKKIAVCRDEKGAIHANSAVCPHLGCVVAWNTDNKTWDCPCHGSRFDKDGKVLNGPSLRDLEPIAEVSRVP